MKNIIIMGKPAAGKGTVCERLVKELGFEHISTGDILREEQRLGTAIGRLADRLSDVGGFMPDNIVISLVKVRVINSKNSVGFLFDGFPRTKEQAKQLHVFLVQRRSPISKVIFLDVDENDAIERLIERGRKKGRVDDDPAFHRKRFNEYEQKTAPLVSFFENKGLLCRIPSTNGVDAMCEKVIATVIESAN